MCLYISNTCTSSFFIQNHQNDVYIQYLIYLYSISKYYNSVIILVLFKIFLSFKYVFTIAFYYSFFSRLNFSTFSPPPYIANFKVFLNKQTKPKYYHKTLKTKQMSLKKQNKTSPPKRKSSQLTPNKST